MRHSRACFLAALTLLGGCKSAFVSATVRNQCVGPITLVEVDYPSASFGIQSLAPSTEMHYRFKTLGSGPIRITYTDGAGKEHTASGPSLNEGLEGALQIVVDETGVQWRPSLHGTRH